MAELGRNPAKIIPAWQKFLDTDAADSRPARGVGEPIWAGRGADELIECQVHEALLNVAVDPTMPVLAGLPVRRDRAGAGGDRRGLPQPPGGHRGRRVPGQHLLRRPRPPGDDAGPGAAHPGRRTDHHPVLQPQPRPAPRLPQAGGPRRRARPAAGGRPGHRHLRTRGRQPRARRRPAGRSGSGGSRGRWSARWSTTPIWTTRWPAAALPWWTAPTRSGRPTSSATWSSCAPPRPARPYGFTLTADLRRAAQASRDVRVAKRLARSSRRRTRPTLAASHSPSGWLAHAPAHPRRHRLARRVRSPAPPRTAGTP